MLFDIFKSEAEWRGPIAVKHNTQLTSPNPFRRYPPQGLDADHIVPHIKIDIFAQAHFKRVG